MASLHISIAAEPIFHIGQFAVTNSMFSSAIVSALIIIIALIANSKLKQTKRPTGLQNLMEVIVEGLYNLTIDTTQDKKKAAVIFPFVGSFFIFILLNNWFGLLPGVGTIGILENESSEEAVVEEHSSSLIPTVQAVVHEDAAEELEEIPHEEEEILEEGQHAGNTVEAEHALEEDLSESESGHATGPKFVPILRGGTADLNTTLALALFSIVSIQVIGVKFLGAHYFQKYINFKEGPIMFFVGLLEIISEISKILSFAFRLFGNIFAGEVLLAVIAFIVPIIAPVPFLGLEVFVGFIQALVFAMLTLVFMNVATQGHGEGEHA